MNEQLADGNKYKVLYSEHKGGKANLNFHSGCD